MARYVIFAIWVVVTLFIWTTFSTMISAASDIAVVGAIALLIAYVFISVKTKCFTILRNKLRK
jgi:hypothetical protein